MLAEPMWVFVLEATGRDPKEGKGCHGKYIHKTAFLETKKNPIHPPIPSSTQFQPLRRPQKAFKNPKEDILKLPSTNSNFLVKNI